MKLIKYKTAWARTPTELEEIVNKAIEKGYVTHGDLVPYLWGGNYYLIQPMVKYEIS